MANPYELWQTHTLLAVLRATKPETWYFGQFYTQSMRSTDEWIDLEKLPIFGRKAAPYVKPLGRGKSVYTDSQRTMRFKPAYTIIEETVGPLDGMSMIGGIDRSMLHPQKLTIPQRRALLKAAKASQALIACERRWEIMRAKAIIDGEITIVYEDGQSVLVDFQRDNSLTETLTSGNKWGDSGVSILDSIQETIDDMVDIEFGGMPTRITMGGNVAKVVRKDAEILDHMDINVKGGVHEVDRSLTGGGKVYKFGELQVGGNSGSKIELWVNDETYDADDGTSTRYLGANDVLFTADPSDIMGYECFGMIVDQDADYQALPIFPKNFTTGDDVKTEHMTFKSAPLMVPVNTNATAKKTVL